MQLRTFKNTERGKWVGRGLVTVGLIAMSVCIYFQGRHGWNLGTILPDKIALATMHGLVDVATALLVSGGAILFAWYMRKMGFAACVFALLLTCFSVLSVSGFMSGRIAALEGQKAALSVLDKYGKWAGGTTYQQAGRSERTHLRMEMRANLKEMVRVASIIPDSHAMAIANMTGLHIETVQRVLILISSGMAQAIKYICLLVGFFLLSNRDERNASLVSSSPKGGSSSGGETRKPSEESKDKHPETVVQFPARANAQADPPKVSSDAPRVPALAPSVSANHRLHGASVSTALRLQPEWPNQQAIADALGVSKGKVSKDLKRLKGQRKVETKRNGKSNAVIARRNGGGLHAVI